VHAWVLIKAGARDVAKDAFVEVTSGRTYSPQDCPYHGIEFAWNHRNYWVCMGMPEPHSDSRLHPAKAHFRWEDAAMWEPLMKEAPTTLPAESLRATAATPSAGEALERQGSGESVADTQARSGTLLSTGAGLARSTTRKSVASPSAGADTGKNGSMPRAASATSGTLLALSVAGPQSAGSNAAACAPAA
jgi:hypothetical protein